MEHRQDFLPGRLPASARFLMGFCSAVLLLLAGAVSASAQTPPPAPTVTHERGRAVEMADEYGPYYAYVPEYLTGEAQILVLIHGTPPKNETALANARFYVQTWAGFAETYGWILIAPAFSQEDFSSVRGDHALGGYRGLFGREIDADAWVLRLVEAYRREYTPTRNRFYLYGHSAGGQFTARFLVMHPEAVQGAVITSAATYPQPDVQTAWPFGMGALHTDIVWDARTTRRADVVPEKEKWLAATRIPLTVIVGMNDTAELPADLIPGQKGKNRLPIARSWVQDMTAFARASGVEPRIRLEMIPGKGHTMSGLLPYSTQALLSE